MKRLLALTLSLIMSASVFASCEKDKKNVQKNPENSEIVTDAQDSEKENSESSEKEEDPTEAEDKSIPKSEIPNSLKNINTASLKFSMDMNVDDFVVPFNQSDYKNDESRVKLSIEDVEGVPMLKVVTLDQDASGRYKVPKIDIKMDKLFEGYEDMLPKIFAIRIDVVTMAIGTATDADNKECSVPAFFGGKIATKPRVDAGTEEAYNSWNELLEFGESEWDSEWAYYELYVRPGVSPVYSFVNTTEPQSLAIMKWGIDNDACYYIADIQFEDIDGNVIPCQYDENIANQAKIDAAKSENAENTEDTENSEDTENDYNE